MKGVNKVILVGHLGKDPEIQYLDSGVCLAKFSLATTESYKDRNGNKVDQTEWHNIVIWRKLAEVAEKYLRKGNAIYLEGKIQTRSWDDKDGNKKYMTEIVADNFVMLDKKSDSSDYSGQKEQRATSTVNEQSSSAGNNEEEYADDLPF